MSTFTQTPDTSYSQPVFALVAHDFEYNDETHYRTDGHHVRSIFVNSKDAEAALDELTLQSLKDFSFEEYSYNLEDILPGTMTEETFCEKANKMFGSIYTFSSSEIALSDLDAALKLFTDEQKLKLLDLLKFSFGKVITTNLVAE